MVDNVCVIGLGYIGLPTAAILAANGCRVTGVDVNPVVVRTVNSGKAHVEEPGLESLVRAAVASGSLVADSVPTQADVFIIAVPTPLHGRTTDLRFVVEAARAVVPYLQPGNLVILESTVPPGTTVEILVPLLEESNLVVGENLFVAHCPERVLPGRILQELSENDRVIGGVTSRGTARAQEVYARFVSGNLYPTDATTAELVKVMENTYRDVNIALSNELSRVCHRLGLDAWEVIELANHHPRVNLLNPGPGVGGHCLPVDPWFVVEKAPHEARLIRMAREINDAQPLFVARMAQEMTANIAEPRIAVLGIAYKENVDDVRESPALEIVAALEASGAKVRMVDPHVSETICPVVSMEEACDEADLLVLVTAHDEFRNLVPADLAGRMRNLYILDTRNVLCLDEWVHAGFTCRRLGDGRATT